MIAALATLVTVAGLVVVVDLAVKRVVVARFTHRALSLGAMGRVQAVRSRIWMTRAAPALGVPVLWMVWATATAAAIATALAAPPTAGWFGLLIGGALSHAIETTRSGGVCDYICLRFWPAFNLADAAITVGTVALFAHLLTYTR